MGSNRVDQPDLNFFFFFFESGMDLSQEIRTRLEYSMYKNNKLKI